MNEEDWTIIEKFAFKIKPIGVKYLVDPPDTMEKFDGKIAPCEMLQKAQENKPFYADVSNHAAVDCIQFCLRFEEDRSENNRFRYLPTG